ncbi:sugar ABC transporter ATP-binding protein [Klebsiella variicola]|nr:sugar ABC transporter ATP-binding protein [Klebsiella variicola]
MASVELIDVAKRYGKQTVLQPLDLTIPDGSFTVLVGPSGCGKSTLLRLLAGLETLSGGTILMNKRPVNDLDPADRDVAMVFQSYALYPHLTVAENLAFHMQVKKVDKQLQKSKVQQVASLLGIDKLLARYPRALSGGQRQRVAMGRAMVRNPQVFLFDEPLSNLDAQLRMELRAEIKSLHQRINTTMIYVTHDQGGGDDPGRSDCGDARRADRPAGGAAGHLRPALQYLRRPLYRLPADESPARSARHARRPARRRLRRAVVSAGRTLASGRGAAGRCPADCRSAPAGYSAGCAWRAGNGKHHGGDGESTLLHLDWQGFPVHVQVAGRVAVAAQQTLGLTLRRENLHLFDAASGERLAETR